MARDLAAQLERIETRLAELEKHSHPPVEIAVVVAKQILETIPELAKTMRMIADAAIAAHEVKRGHGL